MEKELKCPKCGSKYVVDDDTYDIAYGDGEITYSVCGHCENCGVSLQWREHYTFDGFDDIHEDAD